MKKQAVIFTTLIFALVTLTGYALAGNGRNWNNKTPRNCPRFMNGPGQQWVNLTPEQQTQLKALHQKFVDETASQRVGLTSKREAIRILMQTTSPDRNQLIALTGELADLQKALMAKGIDFTLEARKIAPELRIPMMFHGMGGGLGMGMFPNRGGRFHGQAKWQGYCQRPMAYPAPATDNSVPSADE